ncbi:hypothetical protein CGLO_03380 [Colletotrichum gloeosporioides Cg-14]|uniref:Uncharacterized protein n=1 Tax=Colletotrichum gloeosporioides (strain Cg-14) TaxID=1237896 RepID=T0M6Q7_COLGC|nr:hypothetical protein CGLO_03380 [Colletotrichum gloeosporioides Cg-14]
MTSDAAMVIQQQEQEQE